MFLILQQSAPIAASTSAAGWRDFFTVSGWFFGLISLSVAVYQFSSAKNAREARDSARRELLNQRASDEFDVLTRDISALADSVRGEDWNSTSRLAGQLRMAVAKATGAWKEFLLGSESDQLDVAVSIRLESSPTRFDWNIFFRKLAGTGVQ